MNYGVAQTILVSGELIKRETPLHCGQWRKRVKVFGYYQAIEIFMKSWGN